MCFNCVNNVDMIAVNGLAAAGVVSAGARGALGRLGLHRGRSRRDRDLDVADFLTELGLDSQQVFGIAPRGAAQQQVLSDARA